MGLRPLGPRWLRRITRVTGLHVVHASGNGGYVFGFTTVDHRHGVFDLYEYRRWVAAGGPDDGAPAGESVWSAGDPTPPGQQCGARLASCRLLFPPVTGPQT